MGRREVGISSLLQKSLRLLEGEGNSVGLPGPPGPNHVTDSVGVARLREVMNAARPSAEMNAYPLS